MIQQENLKKRLARLAAPIFIETLLIMMLGAVDTVMLSRHSDNSVAAVGVVNQIIMLTFLVFEGGLISVLPCCVRSISVHGCINRWCRWWGYPFW
mgnify:CR=1 FL=1